MNSRTANNETTSRNAVSGYGVGIGYFAGVMEACWLAAVILVPCHCNPFAESEFQPSKILIFRILALVLAAAWIGKACENWLDSKEWISRVISACRNRPIVCALAFLAAVYFIANCFSVNHGESFWGRYDTREGTFTFFCALLFTTAVGTHLRRRDQVERLISTISITGLVLSVYAIFERAGHGALPVLEHTRVSSFLGHPMYFADYLTLVIPVTAWRLRQVAKEAGLGKASIGFWQAGLAFWSIALITELTAFVFTGSRAGLLGLVAAAIFIVLAVSAFGQRRLRLLAGLGIVILTLFFLVLLNVPNGPLKPFVSTPLLARYSQVFSQKEAAASVRMEFWQAAARILKWQKPLEFPGSGTDTWHSLRLIVGYGPETMGSVLSREYANPEPNPALEDRAHNSFWDTFLNLGLLGVIATTALIVLAFYEVYRRLGLMDSARRKWLFFGGLAVASIGSSITLAKEFGNVGLAGVGFEFGLAVGLTLYLITALSLRSGAAIEAESKLEKHSLLLAVLAALLAHLVDNTFGFETSSTLILAAIYFGLILALDRESGGAESKQPPSTLGTSGFSRKNSQRTSGWVLVGYPAFGSALIMVSFLFTFLTSYADVPSTCCETLVRSLAPIGGPAGGHNPYTVGFLVVTWLLVSIAFSWEQGTITGGQGWVRGWLVVMLVSGAVGLGYALLQSELLTRIGPLPDQSGTVDGVRRQGLGYWQICIAFIGLCLLWILAAGFKLEGKESNGRQKTAGMVPLIPAAMAVVAMWCLEMPSLEAEVLCHWADVINQTGRQPLALGLYGQAVDLEPDPFIYRENCAQTFRNLAEADPDPQQYDKLMSGAEATLLRRTKPGMDSTDLDLGDLYLQWGAHQQRAERKLQLGEEAKAAFQRAQVFEPLNQLAWRENSIANHLLLGDDESAKRDLEKARQITKMQNKQTLGDYFTAKATSVGSPGLREEYGTCAIEYYSQALEEATAKPDDATLLGLYMKRAYANLAGGKESKAIDDYSAAANFSAQPGSWQAEVWLAKIYAHEGRADLLDQHLRRALQSAPPEEQQKLAAWRQQLGNN